MGCSFEESVSTISLNSISPDLITYPKKEFIEDFICCICFNIPLDQKDVTNVSIYFVKLVSKLLPNVLIDAKIST